MILVEACIEAWKKNKCRHYSISTKNLILFKIAKMFNLKLNIYLQEEVRDMLLL